MRRITCSLAIAAILLSCGPPRRSVRVPVAPSVSPVWPVAGVVVSPYRSSGRPDHAGVDLAAKPGTPVRSPLAGKVGYAGPLAGYGNVVVVEHEASLTTILAQLGGIEIRTGARVGRGTIVGRVGPDGYVHYEIRRQRFAIDPAEVHVAGTLEMQPSEARAHHDNDAPRAIRPEGAVEIRKPVRRGVLGE